jgi:hypothetical protein
MKTHKANQREIESWFDVEQYKRDIASHQNTHDYDVDEFESEYEMNNQSFNDEYDD